MYRLIRYTEKYQEQYCALYIATWKVEPYGELFTSAEIVEHMVKNQDYLFLLFEEKSEKLIGFVGGRPILKDCPFFVNNCRPKVIPEKSFYIDELGIEEDHKRYGWGQMLMEFIISVTREKGFSEFILRTHSSHSNPAIGLYYKLGFKLRLTETGEVFGVDTFQTRIDERAKEDFRIYFLKKYSNELV